MFNEMLRRLEAGDADGILVWAPDRLSRNPTDSSRIMEMLEAGVIRTVKFPGFPFANTSHGRYALGLALVQASYYSDALSESTRGGLEEKIVRKEYPGRAPIGYLNDARVKRIAIDRRRAPIVREVFERYASGTETLDSIREFLGTKGVLSRGGKLVCRIQVRNILKNPTYYGHFPWRGTVHEGGHERIVTKHLFDRVQEVLDRRKKWSPKTTVRLPKPFVQLLKCRECGYSVTAEVQKGHTYYRCTRKARDGRTCSQPYVRQEVLAPQLSELLRPFALRKDWATECLSRIDAEIREGANASETTITKIQADLETTTGRLQSLKLMLLDRLIEHAEALQIRTRLMGEKKRYEEEIAELEMKPDGWLERFRDWILEAQRVGEHAESPVLTERATTAKKIFGSNLVLDGKKARGVAENPWALIPEDTGCTCAVAFFHAARTHFQGQLPASPEQESNLSGLSPRVSRPGDTRRR